MEEIHMAARGGRVFGYLGKHSIGCFLLETRSSSNFISQNLACIWISFILTTLISSFT